MTEININDRVRHELKWRDSTDKRGYEVADSGENVWVVTHGLGGAWLTLSNGAPPISGGQQIVVAWLDGNTNDNPSEVAKSLAQELNNAIKATTERRCTCDAGGPEFIHDTGGNPIKPTTFTVTKEISVSEYEEHLDRFGGHGHLNSICHLPQFIADEVDAAYREQVGE